MLNKKDVLSALRISRVILYAVFFLVYVYGRFFFTQDTLCNHGYTCPFCGLRTAMFYLAHGRFSDAVNSNKLCVAVVIFFALAAADLIFIGLSKRKKKP